MWNSRLNESQAGIKIAGRNNNNIKYTDDTTLMAESKEKLKSLLMKMKEESAIKKDMKATRIYCVAQSSHNAMCEPGWEGSWGENGYTCTYGWVLPLLTWNYHNIVNQLYPSTKSKV